MSLVVYFASSPFCTTREVNRDCLFLYSWFDYPGRSNGQQGDCFLFFVVSHIPLIFSIEMKEIPLPSILLALLCLQLNYMCL